VNREERNGGAMIDDAKTKPLISGLWGRRGERPPFWLMRQAGRYLPEYRVLRDRAEGFLDFCYRPELAVEATLQPVRRFGMDGAIVFSDILVVPHAMGMAVSFVEKRGPVLEPVRSSREVLQLAAADVVERLQPVYETVRQVAAALPREVTVLGFAGAPWTLATYMVEGGTSREFSNVKRWAFADAEAFGTLIDKLVGAVSEHLAAQVQAGAEAVQIFDSWAGVLPGPAFRSWCIEPVAEIVRRLRATHPQVPVIAFPRGAGVGYVGYARATGVDAVALDSTVPTDWAARELQADSALQGNLDPQLLAVGGEPMAEAVCRIINDLGRGPFVFNLGHGVVPDTPPEHVSELAGLIRGH
jgi:uroporphyrinogen decarboxylase